MSERVKFAVAYSAMKFTAPSGDAIGNQGLVSGLVESDSKDEAYRAAMRKCKEIFPPKEGWSNHSVALSQPLE